MLQTNSMRAGFLLLCITLCCLATGQNTMVGVTQKFIFRDEHNGFVLIESMQSGMTLYNLSRKYNLTMDQVLAANPDLDPSAIPLGFPINIPIDINSISFKTPADDNGIWLSYRVQPKETLYRISKVYLNTTPETITALNPSAVNGLNIGQVLHVGWYSPSTAAAPIQEIVGIDSLSTAPKDFILAAKAEGQVIREQKGLAVWKPGPVTSHYYVLHSTAKVGTYMEITNPMLHRTITAKVAGNIPSGLYQSHVGIVVSPSTARALGVLDPQFFASWRYVE